LIIKPHHYCLHKMSNRDNRQWFMIHSFFANFFNMFSLNAFAVCCIALPCITNR
jgi:nitric oxide reductase large subunit